jgi:membrane-associated phospholipid phosphatase
MGQTGRVLLPLVAACAFANAPAHAQLLPPAALPTLSLATTPHKSNHDTIETAGQIVAIALPVVAGGISAWKDDWTGVAQMLLVTGATVGTAYGLKHLVHEQRPDGSNDQSFPSDTAALAFAPANYLWDRYGWQYGVPAYAAAAFVGYSRVESKQHHWWDVAASATMAFGYSWLITTTYTPWRGNLQTGLLATPDGAYVSARYEF